MRMFSVILEIIRKNDFYLTSENNLIIVQLFRVNKTRQKVHLKTEILNLHIFRKLIILLPSILDFHPIKYINKY